VDAVEVSQGKACSSDIPESRAPIVTRVPGHRDIELVRYYDQFLGYYENCEPETKRWFVEHAQPHWVTLDCGANVGYYSILFSRLCPSGRVYAFEPTETADMLFDNLRHCGALDKVEILRVAVGAKCGSFEESVFRIWGQKADRRPYPFTTIDAFVGQRQLRVDAIKIDVDSFDLEVLQGAQQTLLEQDPYVMVELNDALHLRRQSVPEALYFMAKRGYQMCEIYDRENFLFKRQATRRAPGAHMTIRLADAKSRVEGADGRRSDDQEVVASRWAENPDQEINWATIPHVNRRAAAMVGATDLAEGFWVHMLNLYSDPGRPIRRALSLACGLGHQERTLARFRKFDECDAFDISEGALEKARQFAEAEGLQNINYECRDIDALKLTHQYDIVIAGGVHHISNLENLFSEVSRSLAPGGFLLMYEYIGPSQCQPTARQLEAINACIRLLPTKYRVRVSAQRKLGVRTLGEALAAVEARRAEDREAARELEAGKRPPGGVAGQANAGGMSATLTAEPPNSVRRGMPRLLELLGRAAAALRRGDFVFRLRMFVIRCLQPSVAPDPDAANPSGGENGSASVEASAPAAQSAVAGTPPGEGDEKDFPDEYFWNRWIPMTREQWNAVDPSESVRSDEIVPLLKRYFKTVDVRYTGGSIMQFTLYDLAGNFYDDNEETRDLLDMLFKIEEVLVRHDDVPQNYAVIVAKND
jgi:FkbM family methyltransferase